MPRPFSASHHSRWLGLIHLHGTVAGPPTSPTSIFSASMPEAIVFQNFRDSDNSCNCLARVRWEGDDETLTLALRKLFFRPPKGAIISINRTRRPRVTHSWVSHRCGFGVSLADASLLRDGWRARGVT
ncbi:hypothetical protein OPV22_027860 [Ensete ventricosum]|uniref:Uncharacterized protein n=1 Tax=Ensete ventricosum TaxID=4639 RepID=A0AAV8PWK8_ENSVE|nr:hypothetical protein OPV22_027860 [Ensete ventricosum]